MQDEYPLIGKALLFSGRAPACQKSLFDTCNENLRIFIAPKENCGNLKTAWFSGRFPDGRYYFLSAYALEKYKRDVHAAALDFYGWTVQGFSTV